MNRRIPSVCAAFHTALIRAACRSKLTSCRLPPRGPSSISMPMAPVFSILATDCASASGVSPYILPPDRLILEPTQQRSFATPDLSPIQRDIFSVCVSKRGRDRPTAAYNGRRSVRHGLGGGDVPALNSAADFDVLVLLQSHSPASRLTLHAQSISRRADHRLERSRSEVVEPSRDCWPKPDSVPQRESGRERQRL